MENSNKINIDELLTAIPFPGEDEKVIVEYLESHQFADKVMVRVLEEHQLGRKTAVWGVFALFNLLLLVLFGTGEILAPFAPQVPNPLEDFIFLFLGISLMGSVVGIVLSLDTTWFDKLIHRT